MRAGHEANLLVHDLARGPARTGADRAGAARLLLGGLRGLAGADKRDAIAA